MTNRSKRKLINKKLKELVQRGWTYSESGRVLSSGYITKRLQKDQNDSSFLDIVKSSRIAYINDEEKFQILELLRGLGMNPTENKFIKI